MHQYLDVGATVDEETVLQPKITSISPMLFLID